MKFVQFHVLKTYTYIRYIIIFINTIIIILMWFLSHDINFKVKCYIIINT